MRKRPFVLLGAVLFSAPSAYCQATTSNDLSSMLRDAYYIFNRFDETSVAIKQQIETSYPADIKGGSKEALIAIQANVEREKPVLNAMLKQTNVPASDLFDVYSELIEIAEELDGQSTSTLNWGDSNVGTEFARLGNKSRLLSAHLGVALRDKISLLEVQQALCTHKNSSSK